VQESFDEGSLVDYSVGIAGISDGLGYFIPQQLMDALFGIAEVAG
jgi:hypothetical protein